MSELSCCSERTSKRWLLIVDVEGGHEFHCDRSERQVPSMLLYRWYGRMLGSSRDGLAPKAENKPRLPNLAD